MRDTHKLKEKYELSLDNRQIVSITVASLVVLAGVFMLGVVVGKKLSTEAGAEAKPPADLLTQLDEKSKALEQVQQDDASLTFQDELTKKTPTLVAGAPVVKPVEPPKPAEPLKAPEPVKPEPLAEAPTPKPEPVALPETPKAEPVPTRTHDAGLLKEAFGKMQKAPETAADGAWSIQLAAYQDRAEADRFAAGLRDKGYAPYIVEAAVAGKGTWFRVRMGRFATKDAAGRYLEDFKRETAMNAIVTTAN